MTTSTAKPYELNEEIANAITHGVGALLSVAALTLLLTNAIAENDITKIVSYSIYGSCLLMLFMSSTLYHAFVNVEIKKVFKLFDHCAIYLLIAGTYTPILLVSLKGTLGYAMLALIWLLAIAGVLFKVKFGNKYKKISLATYIVMGLISLTIIHRLYLSLPSEGLSLLAIGGATYLIGVIFYVQKRVPFNHAIWHLFVLLGAGCHFFMIWQYLS